MSRPLACTIVCVLLLTMATRIQAATFELLPTYDTYVSNDPSEGPTTSHEGGSGMHARDVGGRRRVGFLTYDISEAKTLGAFFTSAGFSNYGHDGGTIHVYGIIESQEDLVTEGLTWNNAPGVQNSPTPALDDAVALDPADLTDILLTFNAPARGVREATETSEALAEFLSSDTNGFVAFMFAPDAGGNAILRTVEMGEEGGTLLTGEVGGQATAAQDPRPDDEATDVYRETDLSWTPGGYAATHDVYLGTSFEDVNTASRAHPMGVLLSEGQDAVTYDPGRLELGTTYYWRIDEVNAPPDATIFPGDVWSFTVEPFAYPITNITVTSNITASADAGPEKTIDGSGLNDSDQHSTQPDDMWLTVSSDTEPVWIQYDFDRVYKLHELWVWNYNVLFELALGFGLKDVTVEYSTDGESWTAFGDFELAQATAWNDYTPNTTIDFAGVAAGHVRLTVQSGWGVLGQFGLSEVRFYQVPAFAREPQPTADATGVSPNAVLSWRAGRDVASHEVYLGTDPEAPASIGTTTESSIAPSNLEFGTTYYWRVDEVNEAEAISVWEGNVWTFTTQEYALIDGFESYNDEDNLIYEAWIDGWVNETGSTVGYLEAPFAEQTIVNSGRQSMPLEYSNDSTPFYSEAERTLVSQDWTTNGADSLIVHFQGRPGPFFEAASGDIVIGGAGTDIWGTADEFRCGYKPLSGDGSIVARIDGLADTDVWAKAGVMIRESLDPGSTFAAVYLTGDSGVRYQARLTTDAEAVSDTDVATDEQIALHEPVWIKIERAGNTFSGSYSTDGATWTAMSWNPQTIAMTNAVYIGLAVTSHVAGTLTSGQFANVETTGNVTGSWQIATIGPEQPAGNDPAPLYVAIEDNAGHTHAVSHPAGEAATLLAGWNQWQVPLSAFGAAGVAVDRVTRIIVGVGDRDNPQAGGSGLIYIDDIQFGRPAATE